MLLYEASGILVIILLFSCFYNLISSLISILRLRATGSLAMSEQLHPGIICAVALIPAILIVIITLTILKGFNLLSSLCKWRPKSQSEPLASTHPTSFIDTAGGSCTTIKSSFIGQAGNESLGSIVRPLPVHYGR
ncbi:hypothetical protein K445DRAFT_153479 [Daldinia sp. EC12]|nr:hypothetical protein K445DRAFT_153479 [Daldinia sp. EC12]